MTLLARGRACAHGSRLLPRQSNDCVWVRLEIEPPRGMAFVPVVDRERDQVGAVFEVADEHAALLPGLPPVAALLMAIPRARTDVRRAVDVRQRRDHASVMKTRIIRSGDGE